MAKTEAGERRAKIVAAHIGFEDESRTLEEIAKEQKISFSRVRQLYNAGISDLRKPLTSAKLRGFLD